VTGLVYVAALAPDAGEALGGLLEKTPAASTGIAPSKEGFLFLDPAVYAERWSTVGAGRLLVNNAGV
jgi:hypothetical protein